MTNAQNPSFAYLDRVLEGRYLQTDGNFAALRDVLRELGASAQPTPETLKRYALFLEAGFEPRTVTAAAVALNAQNRHRFEDLGAAADPVGGEGAFSRRRRRGLSAKAARPANGDDRAVAPGRLGQDAGIFRHRPVRGLEGALFPEMLRLAAEQSRGKGAAVGAIDKLLSAWEKEGVSTPEQARARRERPAEKKAFDNPAPAL